MKIKQLTVEEIKNMKAYELARICYVQQTYIETLENKIKEILRSQDE